jgi:hypothetical protein
MTEKTAKNFIPTVSPAANANMMERTFANRHFSVKYWCSNRPTE